jgi:uncharacterized protein
MLQKLSSLYEKLILKNPIATIVITLIISVFFATQAQNFKLDASADSLTLENDQALKYYRSIKARYGSDDFLIITYTPEKDLFSSSSLSDIKQLREKLKSLKQSDSVTSLLDVPLVESPPVTLSELSESIRTLETPGMDINLARKELLSSPLYKNLIVSPDGKTTALQINLKRDEKYHELLSQRNNLREKQLLGPLSADESNILKKVTHDFIQLNQVVRDQESQLIANVRSIMDEHRHSAKLFLGGVPMITADSIAYIENDLKTFGIGVVMFIMVILALSFKKIRWVILPMITCVGASMIMVGILGTLEWGVTVVSSNFISLLLIITLSLCIHIIVRYREIHVEFPENSQYDLVKEAVNSKFKPSFYTAITTMVAFGSLIISDIRPVIDFGWMMVFGIAVAFTLTFTFFPAALILLKRGEPAELHDTTGAVTHYMAYLIHKHGKSTLLVFTAMAVFAVVGISHLSVENRFIDYFKEHTEIYQGMLLIDKELGGTTPLDVIIDAPASFYEIKPVEESSGDPDEDFEFELDEDEDDAGITATSYWFNSNRLEQVRDIQKEIEALPETGKVISIDTTIAMLDKLKDSDDMSNFFMSILYKRVPKDIKDALFKPYMSEDGNQIRFSIRVYESDKNLNRKELLRKIRHQLTTKLGLEDKQIQLSGMVVLYNNMLQSLFKSQILTIGVVFLAILFMFAFLFKSAYIAVLAIIPNMIAAGMVLGVMGISGIPLDIMTITIAAICIGIAVDDTIHYVHRFQEEFEIDRDYWAAINRCHESIGRAMYYTTVTVTLGFSILALSNFMPMIYFGVLTGFAMLIALLANMTLLPLFLAMFKPVRD